MSPEHGIIERDRFFRVPVPDVGREREFVGENSLSKDVSVDDLGPGCENDQAPLGERLDEVSVDQSFRPFEQRNQRGEYVRVLNSWFVYNSNLPTHRTLQQGLDRPARE